MKKNYSKKLFEILNKINNEKHHNLTKCKKLKLTYSKNFIKKKIRLRNLKKNHSLSKNLISNSNFPKKFFFEKKNHLKNYFFKNKIRKKLEKEKRKDLWEIKKLKYSGELIKSEIRKIKKMYINFDKNIKVEFSEFNNKSDYNNLLKTEKKANSLLNISFLPKITKDKEIEKIKKNIKQKIVNFKNNQKVEKKNINKKYKNKLSKFSDFILKNKISKNDIKNFPTKSYEKKNAKEFLLACKLGQKKKVVYYLKKEKYLIYEYDYFNMTGLHWSVKRGHHEIIDLLLKNGSYNEFIDIYDRTPLYYAIENKDPVSLLCN